MSIYNILLNLQNSEIKELIEKRTAEFRENGKKDESGVFNELCFCLMTANFNAKKSIEIQEKVGMGFLKLDREELALKLKELGHRFPNTRAGYIFLARDKIEELDGIIKSSQKEEEKREWLVKNIKGLGYKEASHFLRNIGFKNHAIIDFHIVDVLEKNNLIKKPKTLNKKNYFEIENKLKEIGKKANLDMARLDLYLWYLETGKVLK